MIEIIYHNNDRYGYSDQLHEALRLRTSNYSRDIKGWINAEYLFQGKSELTTPVKDYDYFYSSYTMSTDNQPNTKEILLLRLEFIKLITLDSKSPLKKKFVQWLLSVEARYENLDLLPRPVVLGLLELAKLCTYIDMQIKYYNEHKEYFLQSVEDGDYTVFDRWRNALLKIDKSEAIRSKYHISAYVGNLNSKIEQIAFLDSLQSIRNAVFDAIKMVFNKVDPLFPKSEEKALDLANFTREMFQAAGLTPDIKPKHYRRGDQLELFGRIENIDFSLIDKAIAALVK